jgi:hypothetical protein
VKGQQFPGTSNVYVTLAKGTDLKISDPDKLRPPLVKEEVDRLRGLWTWWSAMYDVGRSVAMSPAVPGRPVEATSSITSPIKKPIYLSQARPSQFMDLVFKVRTF